jgi:hypothetical protein
MTYKIAPFIIKKDRKEGIIVISPKIKWSILTEDQAKIQWSYCASVLHTAEKEDNLSKDIVLEKVYNFLPKIGYTTTDILLIKKLKDWDFPFSLVTTGYLISIGASYTPADTYFIKSIQSLLKKAKEQAKIERETPVPKKSNSSRSQYDNFIDEIQGMEDEMFTKKVDFKEWSQSKTISKEILDKALMFYRPRLEEVFEINDGKDEQLNEAYRKLDKTQIKFMLRWYLDLIKVLENGPQKVVTVRKARKVKVKSPSVLVKQMRYMREFPELKLSSISGEKVVGSDILWLYNTKTRKLACVHALLGKKLSVKGTTILNYNDKSTTQKTLRKPELQLKEFLAGGKAFMQKYYDSITSKDSPFSGRINSDILLLKVY